MKNYDNPSTISLMKKMVHFGSRLVIIDSGRVVLFFTLFSKIVVKSIALWIGQTVRFSQLEESTSRGNIKCQKKSLSVIHDCTVKEWWSYVDFL